MLRLTAVGQIRSALLKYPLILLTVGLAGLLLRLAVPAGFMPVLDHGRLALAPCAGSGPIVAPPSHPATDSGAAHHDDSGPKAESGCAFADLSLPAIGGADPVLPAVALVFTLATGLFLVVALQASAALRLRPPLRGPPLPS